MCDEHALVDATLREGMVGRTLTLERARQLNSRSYFYEMLKDNPALREIKPGMEDEYLAGAIDHHIHAFPDFVPRSQDMLQIAVEASRAKMRAIAFKDHWNLTAGAAYLVQRQVDEMVADGRLEHRVEVYGGLGLNLGVNPEAVRIGLQYPNFKCIWFPTFKSYGWARFAGLNPSEDDYVRLVSADGPHLRPDNARRRLHELRLPRRGESDGLRKHGGNASACDAMETFVPPVVFRNAEAGNRICGVTELGDLLLERHFRDEVVDPFIEWLS